MRRGLLAVLAIWLMVVSQGAFAISCSVSFSMPQNTTNTYPLTGTWNGSSYPAGSDNYNCDPYNVGISNTSTGDDYSGNSLTSPTAHGGTLKIYGFWSLTNQLVYTPPSPAFTGTDTATFYVSIDGANYTQTGSLTITVVPTSPTVASISPTSGPTVGGTTVTLTGTNYAGATSVRFGATNATGFTVNSATQITATSPAGAAGTVDVTVTNVNGTSTTSAADQFTYVAPPIANPVSATVAHGSTGNPITLNITGGAPTSVAIATQATHGTATASGTSITYTPTASYSGPDSFTYTATNAGGTSAPATATITVSPPTVTYTPSSPAGGTVSVAYSQSLASASGGTAPYTYTLASGSLPAGITLASNGTLSGTPTASGAYTFTVTATDSSTGTGQFSATSGTLTLNIAAPTITLTPSSLLGGTVGVAYSQSLSASGATPPYSFAVTAGSLPPGLTLSSGGTLSGTPTGTGTFNFTVTATDSSGPYSGSQAYQILVVAPTLSITPSSGGSLSGTLGQAFSQTFTGSGGTVPYHYGFSVNSGTVPTGVSFNTSTGVLSGTPSTAGTVNFTVTATDSSTGTGAPFSIAGTYTLTTAAPTIVVSPSTLTGATVGASYSQTATASGGTAPYTYAVTSGALPAGLTLASGGTLSGTPTAGGTYNFIITATDANSFTGNRAYTVVVGPPTITISPSTLPGATIATAYSQTVSASGGLAPYTYSVTAGALPAGLTLSSSGTLSGTPTAGGTFNFTVTATDSGTGTGSPYSGSRAYSLTVGSPTMVISPASGALSGTAGTAYSRNFTASGGTSPYTYALVVNSGTLPTGLSWNAATATLSGTPTTAGTVNFTVTASDSSTGSGPYAVSGSYTLTVAAPSVAVSPTTLPAPAIATAYSQTVTAANGTAPYTYAITAGALPAGLAFSSGGVLSGTPTAGGTFNFTITATDANSFTASRTYSFTIGAPTVTVNPAAVTAAQITTAYSQTFSATGGTAPYTYTVWSGTLPAGLSLNASTGAVSGTPTALGSSTFTVRAADSSTGTGAPYSGTRSYTLVVGQVIGTAPAVNVTTLSNAPVTVHAAANATGGPFSSIAIVSPPASGTAVVNDLDIVYTPALTTSGAVNFTYALINTAGTSAPIPVTITVNAVPIAVAQKTATAAAGQAVSVDLTEGATGGPFTGATLVSVVPSNAGTASIVQKAVQAPAGVKTPAAAASTYVLNFTPSSTYAGQAVVTYTLSNAFATSVPATVQVSVAARKDPSADPDVAGLINAQIQAARRFATTQIDNYNRRLEALHGTGRAPSDNGLTVAMPGQRVNMEARCQDVVGIAAHDACLRGEGQGTRLSARGKRNPDAAKSGNGDKPNADTGPDLPGADTTDADSTDPNLAFWSAGTLDFGFANTGAQRSGFRFTTGGVTAGADYRVSDQFSVGAGFGYGRDSTDIGNAGTKSTGDSYSLALYGSYRPLPSLFVDGVAGFGTLSFDSRRWVTDANDFATGKRNGKQKFASVSAGYEHRDRTWLVSPYGRLSVSQSTLDQFSESGAGINALTYFEQTVTTVSGTLGLRAEYTQKTKWGTFLPFARVEYQHDFNGQSSAGLAYADLASAGPAYYVAGTPFGRDRVQIGLGSKLRTGPLTFGLDYTVTTGMGGLQQGVRLTFAAPF